MTVLLLLAALVVVATPLDDSVVFGIPFLRNPSAVFAFLLLTLFIVASRGRMFLFSLPQAWAVVFIITIGVMELARLLVADVRAFAYIGAPSLATVFFQYMAWVQPIMLLLLVSSVAVDRRSLGFILYGLPIVMSGLVIGALSTAGVGRWSPLGLNENFAGLSYGISIVIATSWLLRAQIAGVRGALMAALFSTSIPLATIGLLMTGSRTASAATIVGLCVLVAASRGNVRRLFLFLVAALIISLGLGTYFEGASGVLVGRWSQALEGEAYGGRDRLLRISADLFADSPIWGYGLQSNAAVGERWFNQHGRPFSPHNTLAALLLSFGVVGALPWLMMFATASLLAWRHRQSRSGGLLLSLLALIAVYTLAGNLGTDKYTYVLLGLAACLPRWYATEH